MISFEQTTITWPISMTKHPRNTNRIESYRRQRRTVRNWIMAPMTTSCCHRPLRRRASAISDRHTPTAATVMAMEINRAVPTTTPKQRHPVTANPVNHRAAETNRHPVSVCPRRTTNKGAVAVIIIKSLVAAAAARSRTPTQQTRSLCTNLRPAAGIEITTQPICNRTNHPRPRRTASGVPKAKRQCHRDPTPPKNGNRTVHRSRRNRKRRPSRRSTAQWAPVLPMPWA